LTEASCGHTYGGRFDPEGVISNTPEIETDAAFRVIADHARATAFLIAEGIYPDSEGRGYVLRRVMRRAIRYGRKLGMHQPFLAQVACKVADLLGDVFPELRSQRAVIERVVRQEEERFGQTLEAGLKLISTEVARIAAEGGPRVLPGDSVFLLHDTHGFPTDLTALICAEQGFVIDAAGFDLAMAAQKARGKASWKKGVGDLAELAKELEADGLSNQFVGYERDESDAAVLALVVDGQRVEQLAAGTEALLVVDQTPCYAESGGQTGDQGRLGWATGSAKVLDTQKAGNGLHIHKIQVEAGLLVLGTPVKIAVDAERRASIRAHHSATHLLHKALRDVLGSHVRQRGSLVEEGRLRFDFSHYAALSDDEIRAVELHANRRVLANAVAHVELTNMDAAVAKGAMAFFGDKYGEVVRVMQLGDSIELCGGTHVGRTGDIGQIQIVSETAVSAGVRRLEAVCHLAALELNQQTAQKLNELARRLGGPADQLGERLDKLQDQLKAAHQESDKWKQKALSGSTSAASEERQIASYKAVFRMVEGADAASLRTLADQARDQLGSGCVALLSLMEGAKALLLVASTKDAVAKLPAGQIVAELAPLLGGRGGGRPDLAQAGGNTPSDPAAVREAFFAAVSARAGA
jgi:alanyl-tRNA synthetase